MFIEKNAIKGISKVMPTILTKLSIKEKNTEPDVDGEDGIIVRRFAGCEYCVKFNCNNDYLVNFDCQYHACH